MDDLSLLEEAVTSAMRVGHDLCHIPVGVLDRLLWPASAPCLACGVARGDHSLSETACPLWIHGHPALKRGFSDE